MGDGLTIFGGAVVGAFYKTFSFVLLAQTTSEANISWGKAGATILYAAIGAFIAWVVKLGLEEVVRRIKCRRNKKRFHHKHR